MFKITEGEKNPSRTTTPDLDDSISFSDDVNPDIDVESVATKKPHFLDYDAVPPPDFVEHFDRAMNLGKATMTTTSSENPSSNVMNSNVVGGSGENLKLDKKYERDGEISDYELAASGYTKKEFTQDDNTLNITNVLSTNVSKPRKHFLDENPIPPDYMLMDHQMREHHSLDRNFERHNEQKSALDLHLNLPGFRLSRERFKDFPTMNRLPKGTAWTQSFDSRYDNNFSGNKLDDFGPKVECVYSLLSMLGSNDPLEMSKKFYELSKTPETCNTLRRSGCIPLLVQMIHAEGGPDEQRKWAGMALHNVVHTHPDEKCGRREAKVLRLLDQIMDYCNFLRTLLQSGGEAIADDADRHPLAAMSSLMKVSFDEEHRHAMCELGALQAIPSLVHLDHAVHGPKPENQCCNSLRRFALMALTNLTFGDENNKALLCSQKLFMEALVAQLDSAPDDLLQVTASVLRNLSWRADAHMKAVLNEIGTVTALAKAAMKNKCENTLKAILSALWNLSAHCSTNKAEFCAVEGALSFIVRMLTYEGPSKTLKIIENAGGILRNVSSHIAVREDYRQILREHNCLSILLQQLKSESLTVVSNSCGTLWNLSARCPEDQRFLWDNGAVPMLRSLIHSKHAMISEGSACALKNLLNFRPSSQNTSHMDHIARSLNLKKLPTLNVRKQKALEQELGAASKSHSETCDNLDSTNPKDRPTYDASAAIGSSIQRHRFPLHGALGSVVGGVVSSCATARLTRSAMLTKSESRDSVFSAKSEGASYDHLMRSQSASDANRKLRHNTRPQPTSAYQLEGDAEPSEEQPIDYSQKYKEHISKHNDHPEDEEICLKAAYQETDLDQPTDFSLRYAENQIENDIELPLPVSSEASDTRVNLSNVNQQQPNTRPENTGDGNEILLILEDSVKCYQTEDTPYVISNAASVSDLRSVPASIKNEGNELSSGPDNSEAASSTGVAQIPVRKLSRVNSHHQTMAQHSSNPYGSGSYTPEKPVNYCEEGTPGYFSRYESLSSLDEASPQGDTAQKDSQTNKVKRSARIDLKISNNDADKSASPPEPPPMSQTPQINSALETPLMFSRRSSMDSLAEEDVGPIDDKSSVVSDFSRLASGVISPSEIPDSPTQSMPQSPRRNSGSGAASTACFSAGISPSAQRMQNRNGEINKRCLRSVFEDDLSTFNVENTPAQFSTATSLSNLSILDEENSNQSSQQHQQSLPPATTNTISEGEEEEDANENNDDLLLASCINMGMNRTAMPSTYSQNTDTTSSVNHSTGMPNDEPRQYYTEDTPALLSKVGSNTNLSAISICSSTNDHKENTVYEVLGCSSNHAAHIHPNQLLNRRSLNLSDDMSSNASESGAGGIDILQQCIRDGMQKHSSKEKVGLSKHTMPSILMDPIAMLRRGGHMLPPYLPVSDEINKYRVEDSPCNFSIMSGLSNLTVGSSLVGPAVTLQGTTNLMSYNDENPDQTQKSDPPVTVAPISLAETSQLAAVPLDDARRDPQWHDDSLSSLSIESEDDTNLLSQAIAAGCNRPKSNLGFTTALTSTGKHTTTSLSSSQPIPINAATSTSSLTSQTTARNFGKQHQHLQDQQNLEKHNYRDPLQVGNESYSSVDSSDSNDNQSKSLFELCILTGMHKNRDPNMVGSSGGSSTSRKHTRSAQLHRSKSGHMEYNTTKSNPNLKQFDSLPVQGKQLTPNRHVRERDRRDEKLLMECINTGILKKIGESNKQTSLLTREALVLHNTQSKNGPATSAAAEMEEAIHPTSAKSITNTHNSSITLANNTIITTITTPIITAAPGVEMNDKYNLAPETMNKMSLQQTNISSSTSLVEDTKDPKSPSKYQLRMQQEERSTFQTEANPQNHVNALEAMKDIGCKSNPNHCDSLGNDDNTPHSDESNQSFILETTVSLESKPIECASSNKHKDPDLMLKSVERLTLEFVSSAEQLRINSNAVLNGTQSLSLDSSENQKKTTSYQNGTCSAANNSTSNNTWNEDTCPNDVSFPSVSVTAPRVASLSFDDDDEDQATTADYKELNDFAENTPINEELPAPDMSLDFDNIGLQQNAYSLDSLQPISLDCLTETEKTLVDAKIRDESQFEDKSSNLSPAGSNGLHFKLGGIVQTAATAPSLFFNSLTNSTFMAQEARKLAANLEEEEEELTFSINSLDLDNIRPPSGMDSLNISGYFQDSTQPNSLQKFGNSMHSPQMSFKSPKFPRKNLPAGVVARRALGHMPPHLNSSVESINLSCNLLLDNIKPPSLMDELLDSMISVASIQSEIADDCASMATTVTVSNYETCAGGEDGDTVTLQSCCDNLLPKDDEHTLNDGSTTPLPSDCDFSSVESTPIKSGAVSPATANKKTLTPKQKRKIIKDRFKTYTIATDMLLSDELQRKVEEAQQDETLAIEITSLDNDDQQYENEQHSANEVIATPRSRRRTSQDRYKTQTIIYSDLLLNHQTQLSSLESTNDDLMDDNSSNCSLKNMTQNFKFLTTAAKDTNALIQIPQLECELPSLEYEQNSETESCNNFGNNINSLTDDDENDDDLQEEEHKSAQIIHARIVKPNEKDVGKPNLPKEPEAATTVKALRGAKKPQYVSPYSIKYQKTSIENKTACKLQGPVNSNYFRKRNGSASTAAATAQPACNPKVAQKKTLNKETPGRKVEADASSPAAASLERQGTFVKTEPSLDADSVPVVETSPTKIKTSKLPTKRQISATKSAHTSPQKIASTRKLPTSSTIQATNKRNMGSVTKPQRANSTVNIRVTTNAARIAVLSHRVSTTTPPSRSNSSLNSANVAVTAAQNAATKINQAQSRIAGIWRKVDEAKNRQQQLPPSKLIKGSQLKTTKAPPQPGKLKRGSTFDNSPPIEENPAKAVVNQLNGSRLPTSGATKVVTAQRQIERK